MSTTIEEKVSTKGATMKMGDDGIPVVEFDTGLFTKRAFDAVLNFIYEDRIDWEPDTDEFKKEVIQAAKYFHMKRLEIIASNSLETNPTQEEEPPSDWYEKMTWAFNNLRKGDVHKRGDVMLLCKSTEGKEVHVPAHIFILGAESRYFNNMFTDLGKLETKEKKERKVVLEGVSESQILTVLKYLYSRTFECQEADVVDVWFLSNKYAMDELQIECESKLKEVLKSDPKPAKDVVESIKKLATQIKSESIVSACDEFLNAKQN